MTERPSGAQRARLCAFCGQPAPQPDRPGGQLSCRNGWCSLPGRALQGVFWAHNYSGALRRAVLSYKYHGDLRWAKVFARLLHEFLVGHASWFEEFALLCPVPSFQGTGARRQWGHVELFCAELAALGGPQWPVEQLVCKVAETEPMSATSYPDRRRIATGSLAGAFVARPGALIEGQRILLVDDVCTSGATLLAVAGVLRRAGAAEVAGLVVARSLYRL